MRNRILKICKNICHDCHDIIYVVNYGHIELVGEHLAFHSVYPWRKGFPLSGILFPKPLSLSQVPQAKLNAKHKFT